MDRLQGYNTDGHEYRISEIDRSNTRRLKWMMNEAKKNVDKKEQNKSSFNSNKDINQSVQSNKNTNVKRDMFDPSSINKFSNFKNNSFK